MSPFLAWGDFHARSRFARSTIPKEKWGTTRSLTQEGIDIKIIAVMLGSKFLVVSNTWLAYGGRQRLPVKQDSRRQ